jgi:hypothetical protein
MLARILGAVVHFFAVTNLAGAEIAILATAFP